MVSAELRVFSFINGDNHFSIMAEDENVAFQTAFTHFAEHGKPLYLTPYSAEESEKMMDGFRMQFGVERGQNMQCGELSCSAH